MGTVLEFFVWLNDSPLGALFLLFAITGIVIAIAGAVSGFRGENKALDKGWDRDY